MRISIFNLDNNINYKDEYNKIIKVLNTKCITYNKKSYTYFDFVNTYLFNNWKFRNTYLDCYEYLNFIGININSKKVNIDSFINLLEFILNMQLLISNIKFYNDSITYSIPCRSILFHNIQIILEELGYQAYSLDDRVLISKIDINYMDLSDILPNDINDLLISYKSINNNSIKVKRLILYKIYNYMLDNIDKYKGYNTSIFNSIKLVITKMGVYTEIDNKYKDLSNYKLRKYYDNCYYMMTYLLKSEEIFKYRDEIKNENK